MNHLTLRLYPDPILSELCAPVEVFGSTLESTAAEMLRVMREHEGAGLAANQVGIARRLFVMGGTAQNAFIDLVLANPEIVSTEGSGALEEGCLSLPGIRYSVPGRFHAVRLRYQDALGFWRDTEFEGFSALCVQHEMDHLDGLTLLDRLSPLKASRAKAKLAKQRRPLP